jgi:PEP-CTERM motif
MLKKALLVSTALVGLAAISAPASAGEHVIFSASTTASGSSALTPVLIFTTTAAFPVEVTVTDCCIVGDYYATWLNGAYIGTTPYEPEYGSGSGYPNSMAMFIGHVVAGNNTIQLQDQTSFYLPAGVSISISAPEPSTWAMMLLGFAGLGFAAYRRARPMAAITT